MSALERRCRRLLRVYPSSYRRQRGEEMLGTLLEASPPGREWPSPRDAGALIMGGLRVRAGHDQRLPTVTSLRLGVLLGAALALLALIARNLSAAIVFWSHSLPVRVPARTGYWVTYTVLALAAVATAWFAPRRVAVALALTAALLWFTWDGVRVMALLPAGLLIILAVLGLGRGRLPRSWLWLVGAELVLVTLQGLTFDPALYFLYAPLVFVPWIILGAVVLWGVVDARPAIAMAIYILARYLLPKLIDYFGYGVQPSAAWWLYLPAAGAAVLLAGAIWRLRHQSTL